MANEEHWTERIYKELQTVSEYESSLVHALSPEKNRKSYSNVQGKAKQSSSITLSDISCDYSVVTFHSTTSDKKEKQGRGKKNSKVCYTKDAAVMTSSRTKKKRILPLKKIPRRQPAEMVSTERMTSASMQLQKDSIRSSGNTGTNVSRPAIPMASTSSAEYRVISASHPLPNDGDRAIGKKYAEDEVENSEAESSSICISRKSIISIEEKDHLRDTDNDCCLSRLEESNERTDSMPMSISFDALSQCESESIIDTISSATSFSNYGESSSDKMGWTQGSDETILGIADGLVCEKSIGIKENMVATHREEAKQIQPSFNQQYLPAKRTGELNQQPLLPNDHSWSANAHRSFTEISVNILAEAAQRSKNLEDIRKELQETKITLDDSDALLASDE